MQKSFKWPDVPAVVKPRILSNYTHSFTNFFQSHAGSGIDPRALRIPNSFEYRVRELSLQCTSHSPDHSHIVPLFSPIPPSLSYSTLSFKAFPFLLPITLHSSQRGSFQLGLGRRSWKKSILCMHLKRKKNPFCGILNRILRFLAFKIPIPSYSCPSPRFLIRIQCSPSLTTTPWSRNQIQICKIWWCKTKYRATCRGQQFVPIPPPADNNTAAPNPLKSCPRPSLRPRCFYLHRLPIPAVHISHSK